jgi:hypothetical protein
MKEEAKMEQRQEPSKKEFRFPKDIRDLKEEVPAKPVKTESTEANKKKEGERKFDFLHRKGEVRKDSKVEKAEDSEPK